MSEFSEQMNGVREKIEKENRVGGELIEQSCPFCSKPRSQRSSYIRCNPCGVNWFDGDELDRDPRMSGKPRIERTKAAPVEP